MKKQSKSKISKQTKAIPNILDYIGTLINNPIKSPSTMSTSSVRRIKERGGGGAVKVTTAPSTKSSRSTTPVLERPICGGGDSVKRSSGKENSNTSRPISRIRAAATTQKPVVPPMARVDKSAGDSVDPRARWSTGLSTQPKGRSSSPSEIHRGVIPEVRKTRVSRVPERSSSVGRSARFSNRVGQEKKAAFKDSTAKSNELGINATRDMKKSEDFIVGLEKSSELCKELKPKPTNNGVRDSKNDKGSVVGCEKSSEICKELRTKPVTTQNNSVRVVLPEHSREENNISLSESFNTQSSLESAAKVLDSVKVFQKLRSKSWAGSRSSNVIDKKENDVQLSSKEVAGKNPNRIGGTDGSKEKGACDDSVAGQTTAKYPSKLHGKLAFLEEKVKRIASDIKRTKEMLDLNNPDASKVMLSDIQETVAGIEKAMGQVVNKGVEKNSVAKMNGSDNLPINLVKESQSKETSDVKNSAKGLNTDELEARFFPHHKLLRDRTTLKTSSGSQQSHETELAVPANEVKQEEKLLTPIDENLIGQGLLPSLSKEQSNVTTRDGIASFEICEVQETENTVNSTAHGSSNFYNGKGDVETMLTAHETLEECDELENMPVMIFEEETEDTFNNELNEIGRKISTGGWFVSEGESVLLAHDDGSCSFYDVANTEEKSIYKPPIGISPNLWRDCWILRAPGADGCSGRYVVAASAGNSMESGFCSWDFYTKDLRAFQIEDGVTNTRTALAPLSNNVLNRRNGLSNITPESRQWWYRPCGPLIISTASCQNVVKVYDIRDGEHVMKWEVPSPVLAMDNSSPLQWRNRGKVVVAEAESISLWDVGSLNPQPLLSVASSGRKISALHVNNTDAELGGGVRQRVSSSEVEGNDGVFCTPDSINVLDFRHPSGVGLKIPKYGTSVHSVFSRGDSIYLGCSNSLSAAKRQSSGYQVQQFSLRKQKLSGTYVLPESNAHPHYKTITQVWGNSNLVMCVCGLGLFVFDALKDDILHPFTSDYGNAQNVKENIGPDDLYSPSFDYLGSRALLISRDRPAVWRYLS